MQAIFKRQEQKYLLTEKQATQLVLAFSEYMQQDVHGTYWVQNLYFDTENWDIINTSIQKPYYKEKMRLRCYGTPETAKYIFLELKKKYAGTVYKRRISLPTDSLARSLDQVLEEDGSQIARELQFHLRSANVSEKMYVGYRRKAFAGIDDPSLRLTIDSDILYRPNELNFANPSEGNSILPEHMRLMEIKTASSIPLWLSHFLSENEIYGASFSKIGTCFTDYWKKMHQSDIEQHNEGVLLAQ